MEYTREEHIEMIKDPDKWPKWPALPVKKNKNFHDLADEDFGIILDGLVPNKTTVVLCNLFEIKEKISTAKQVKYETVEELVDDGWVVD